MSDDTTRQPSIGGDQISVGNITNAQGVAIGRSARATVMGSTIQAGATIDAGQLKAALQDLWQAIGQSQLPTEQQITAQTAAGNALGGVKDDTVDGDSVVDHVKKAGEALQGANTVIEQGSSLWASVQKLAPLLGPLVGGARVVATWFGIAM